MPLTLIGLEALQTYRRSQGVAWLGAYKAPFVFDHERGEFTGAAPDEFLSSETDLGTSKIDDCRLQIPEADYACKIKLIKDYIRAGDAFQIVLV